MGEIQEKDARKLSLEELKSLQPGDHVYTRCDNQRNKRFGQLLGVKIDGRPKTLKRDPSKVTIPWKYGLYEHGYINEAEEVYVPKDQPPKIFPKGFHIGATVVNKATGEKGDIRGVSALKEEHKQYHGGASHLLMVRWAGKKGETKPRTDYNVKDIDVTPAPTKATKGYMGASVYALAPVSQKAKDWIKKNVQTEPWQWLGNTLVIEHRYVDDIVKGMQRSGLKKDKDFTVGGGATSGYKNGEGRQRSEVAAKILEGNKLSLEEFKTAVQYGMFSLPPKANVEGAYWSLMASYYTGPKRHGYLCGSSPTKHTKGGFCAWGIHMDEVDPNELTRDNRQWLQNRFGKERVDKYLGDKPALRISSRPAKPEHVSAGYKPRSHKPKISAKSPMLITGCGSKVRMKKGSIIRRE